MQILIKNDFKRTWFICSILCIGMMPLLLNEYCHYIMIILLPYVMSRTQVSKNCILVMLFSVCYFLMKFFNGYEYSLSEAIFDLFYPFIMYQAGTLIIRKQSNPTPGVIIIVALAIFHAGPAIYYCIMDVIKTGELINRSRYILSDTGEITRSATGYGMMLALMNGSIGLGLVEAQNIIDKRIKIVILIISIGSLFSVIHLVNRTGIILSALSLLIAALLPPISIKKLRYVFLILMISIGALVYWGGESVFFSDVQEMYDDRNSDFVTYGSRKELWTAGIQQLFLQPLGNSKGVSVKGYYHYAHNLWLDVGIKGSIFSIFILIILTIILMKNLLLVYKKQYLNNFKKAILVIMCATCLLQSFVEPVIEGDPRLFWFLIFYMSIITNLNLKYANSYNIK